MSFPRFERVLVGAAPNVGEGFPMNTFGAAGDIDGDGRIDFAVGGRKGRMFWFHNGTAGWMRHDVAPVGNLECGGQIADVSGKGLGDIICGSDWQSDEVWWLENPGGDGVEWKHRTVARTGSRNMHDTLTVANLKGDGAKHLVFTNQHADGGTSIWIVPFPNDPNTEPWPKLERVASRRCVANPAARSGFQPEEGLAAGDIDGDGIPELVCGTCWYDWNGSGFEAYRFTSYPYLATKCAVGDLDGDGRLEIVLSEGDPCIYGKPQGGRLTVFRRNGSPHAVWEETVLDDGLLDAHTLCIGDICRGGKQDILCGEIGVSAPDRSYSVRPPRIFIYENLGGLRFERHLADEGTGIHDGILIDIDGDGRLDFIGKPLHGPGMWNVYAWMNRG